MTAPQQPHDPDVPLLGEEEEREVAALLAGLEDRGPVTMPPEVAARLDDVLAGLVAERGDRASTAGSGVVPLERRSRAGRWSRGLLAAAAVVVVGYGAVQVVSNGSTGVGSSDSSASSAGGASADSPTTGDIDTQTLGKAGDEAGGSGSGLAGGGSAMSLVPAVRSGHLAADVRRVVRLFDTRGISERPSPGQSAPSTDPSSGSTEELPDCPVPRLTDRQRLYEVRFRGRPAGLVVGAPRQGSVEVTVYACSDGGVRLSRTVPAP